jgi:hypothetical protein
MRWLRRFWPHLVLVLLLGANAAIVWQRQAIGDWLRLRNYQAPNQVVQLAEATAMTDYGSHLFYINHPQLEGKEAFNMHCADRDEETAVLGCYHGDRLGIYVYDVQDKRLAGVQEVTAAHEMLHQAYDRLGGRERQRVNKLLQDFYDNQLADDDIRTKIDSYRSQKDAVISDEMHSILGTEVRKLPRGLETYYRQYFSDRSRVITYSEAYQGEFKRRKQLVADYDSQLASLKTQIDANKSDLDARAKALKTKEAEINQDIANRDSLEYQADVASYNSQVTAYNAKITATRKLIDSYNSIVAARNDIAVEEQQLQQALDSRLAETQ